MFIAIIGTRFSGKSTLEEYLVAQKGFTSVRIAPNHYQNGYTKLSRDGTGFSHHTPGRNSFLALGNTLPSPFIPPPIGWYSEESSSNTFGSADLLLEHVTKHWQDTDFVTDSLTSVADLEEFARRPFFMLIRVDAPLMVRYRRSNEKFHSLESFIEEHDAETFGYHSPNDAHLGSGSLKTSLLSVSETRNIITVNIANASSSVSQFHAELDKFNLLDPQRLRPDWDTYFMTLASLASHRSNCMKRRVGAVLVRDHRLVATGYNGTPRGLTNCKDGGCDHCNGRRKDDSLLYECLCIHAEENVLLEAGTRLVREGAILYCNTSPCLKCAIKIIQAGISEVLYELDYKVDEAAKRLFDKSGVKIRKFTFPPQSINEVKEEVERQSPHVRFAQE